MKKKLSFGGVDIEKAFCCQLISFNKFGDVIDGRKEDCGDCKICGWNLMNNESSVMIGWRAETWKLLKKYKNFKGDDYYLLGRWNEEKESLELAEVPPKDCFEIKKEVEK